MRIYGSPVIRHLLPLLLRSDGKEDAVSIQTEQLPVPVLLLHVCIQLPPLLGQHLQDHGGSVSEQQRSGPGRSGGFEVNLLQAHTHNIYTHTRDAATPAEPAARDPRHPDAPDQPELGVVMQRMGIVSGREGGRLDTRS